MWRSCSSQLLFILTLLFFDEMINLCQGNMNIANTFLAKSFELTQNVFNHNVSWSPFRLPVLVYWYRGDIICTMYIQIAR